MIIRRLEDFDHLGAALAYYRRRRGFTAQAVAQMAKISNTTIADIENRGPRHLDSFVRYADALGVELEINFVGKTQ